MESNPHYQAKPFKHGDADTCTCPHCWTVFPLEDVLYIARHPDLLGDPILGQDVPNRFKPSRFTVEGQAIDPGGYPCLEMACPNCHLQVPRCLAEFRSTFFSIVGTASSGKSYFLATAVWQLREMLRKHFALAFSDVETTLNAKLHSYEEMLFFPSRPDQLVALPKTEQQGELYNRVNFGGTEIKLPKPFLFTISPLSHHPEAAAAKQLSRSLVMYDNAGEHFNPNEDKVTEPGTMHMARSECLFFLFDPTQDPRFRDKLRGHPDPQMDPSVPIRRQDVIFNETARRIRRHVGLSHERRYHKNVVVVVNKLDVWKSMLNIKINPDPYIADRAHPIKGLDVGHVEDVSFSLRTLLMELCPELVSAIEDFAERVVYIPVSTLGHSPTKNAKGGLAVRPADIKPIWPAIPFVYALARLGLVYRGMKSLPPVEVAQVVKRIDGMMFCSLADGSRLDVPVRYAGRTIHHPRTGSRIGIPKV